MYEHSAKGFSKLADLKDHKGNKHPSESDEDKPYCDKCQKSFSSKANLKMHINSKHQNKYIHNCEICGYGTTNKQSMTSHRINEHTSKRRLSRWKSSFVVFVKNISL